jgi:hypothetical protein
MPTNFGKCNNYYLPDVRKSNTVFFEISNQIMMNMLMNNKKRNSQIIIRYGFFTVLISFIMAGPVLADTISGFVVTATIADAEKRPIDTSKLSLKLFPQGTYKTARETVLSARKLVYNTFIECTYSKDSLYKIAKNTLEEGIVNKLVPFWYGTPWDFNGYTQIPNKGEIACGYFVSTVLLHAGFSLNRYTLAQQKPYLEAVSIQLSDSIQMYNNGPTDFFQKFKMRNGEGLYFAGLDCHVGFLLYRKNELIFIHSSYIDPLCVTIETAENSPAFTASRAYYIAEISNNRKLVDCWLKGNNIAVRTK